MSEAARAVLPALVRPLLLIAGLCAAGWALHDLPIHGFAARAGGFSLPAFVAVGAVAVAVGLPRQIVAFAAGYAHGPWVGGALALAAQMIGCAVDLAWARLVARGWLRPLLASRFARIDQMVSQDPFGATLTLRLLPVGSNVALNLLAGAMGVRLAPFLAASALGYLPQTAIFALVGSGVQIARGTRIGLAIAMLAVCLAGGALLLRRGRIRPDGSAI